MEKENSLVLAHPPGPVASREIDYYEVEPDRRTHLRDLFHILLKRKWWVIGTFLGVVAVTTLVIFIMTPIYKATTLLQITQESPAPPSATWTLFPSLRGARTPVSSRKPNTTSSPAGGWRAGSSRRSICRIPRSIRPSPKNIPTPRRNNSESYMIDLFLDKLVINEVKDTYLMQVAYKSQDRSWPRRSWIPWAESICSWSSTAGLSPLPW